MNEIITTGRSLNTITAEIKALTEQAQTFILNTTIELGRRLCEAKAMLPAGDSWLEYLEKEVNYSKSTAENFMRIYKEYGSDQRSLFGGDGENLKRLSYTKALALLAIPREDREDFAAQVNAEEISTRELEEEIRKRKEADAAREAAQQLAAAAQEQYAAKQLELEKAQARAAKAEKEAKAARKQANNAARELEKAKAQPVKVPDNIMEEMRREVEQRVREEAARESQETLAKLERAAQAAREKAEAIERQLKATQASTESPDVAVFGTVFQEIQEDYNRMVGIILKIKATNPDRAASLIKATEALIEKMSNAIRGAK